jgi:hypothetical protein
MVPVKSIGDASPTLKRSGSTLLKVWMFGSKGEATLLKDTTQVLADSAATLQALTVGTRLYVGTGGDVKHTTDLSTFTNCTSEPAGNVGGMATDGFNVFVAFAGHGVHNVTTSSDAFSSYITGTDTFVNLRYVKGRLMASEDNDVYNFTSSGGPGSPLFSHIRTQGFVGLVSLAVRTKSIWVGSQVISRLFIGQLSKRMLHLWILRLLHWSYLPVK